LEVLIVIAEVLVSSADLVTGEEAAVWDASDNYPLPSYFFF
jgi:hypothetical protein